MFRNRFVALRLASFMLALFVVTSAGAQGPSFEERYQEAQKALLAGNISTAQQGFEALTASHPDVAEIHANLGLIYFNQKRFPEAVSQLQTALKLKPALAKSANLLAMSYAELGRFREALPGLQKCFTSVDRESQRMCGLQLLRTYTGLGRDGDAVATGLSLNKSFESDPEVLYETGRIYGNYAYLTMEKLHTTAPNSVWMEQANGEANESQKNYDAAILAFERVLRIDPHRGGIHYRLGRIYLSRFKESHSAPDRSAAEREFKAELETDPGNGNARYELAELAFEVNDLEQAREEFEVVTGEFPEFEEALVGLGGVYLSLSLPEKAASALQKATVLSPADEVAWYKLSLAHRALGNRDAAVTELERFRKLHSASPDSPRPAHGEVTPQTIGQQVEP